MSGPTSRLPVAFDRLTPCRVGSVELMAEVQ